MKSLRGKVAVVTGAGSGIGRALAVALCEQGARLAISDVRADDVAETAALVAATGGEVRHFVLDMTDAAAVQAHASQVVAEFGCVNLVINNAGVAMIGDVLDMSLDDLAWVMNVNYWGVVHGSKAFLPHLITSGDGHLVNLSSVFGLMSVPSQSAYNAAKFAVRGFTEALRMEMVTGGHRVGVSCVHPGGIRTNVVRNSRTAGDVDHAAVARRFDRTLARTSAEKAAAVILRGVQRNRPRILVGADAHSLDAMVRLLGPAYQRLVTLQTKRFMAHSQSKVRPRR